jgi:two-component system, LytTR family, response regulator
MSMKLRALVADDEPLARERLIRLLTELEDVEVTQEARNGREAMAALRENRFDVLFLDIQMPGNDGFEVIEQIGPTHMPATVFVTAHNEYAVQAFEVQALDYVTKPVEPRRLRAAMARVRERIASQAALMTQEQLQSLLRGLGNGVGARPEFLRRVLVHNGTSDSFVNVDEIEWIEAADYYACLHVGAKSFMLRESIKQLAGTLDPAKFVRVHRSVIVNVDQVREIFREGQGEGSVVLKNGRQLRMSKAGWQSLLAITRG